MLKGCAKEYLFWRPSVFRPLVFRSLVGDILEIVCPSWSGLRSCGSFLPVLRRVMSSSDPLSEKGNGPERPETREGATDGGEASGSGASLNPTCILVGSGQTSPTVAAAVAAAERARSARSNLGSSAPPCGPLAAAAAAVAAHRATIAAAATYTAGGATSSAACARTQGGGSTTDVAQHRRYGVCLRGCRRRGRLVLGEQHQY